MASRRAARAASIGHVQKSAPKAVTSTPRRSGRKDERTPCVLKPGTAAWSRLWPQLSEPDPDDQDLPAELLSRRPKTRRDCQLGPRPCPWLSCPFHRYLSVNPSNGSIWINCPDVLPWKMEDSCLLDLIEQRGAMTLAAVGATHNLTKERARQIERDALVKLRALYKADEADGR